MKYAIVGPGRMGTEIELQAQARGHERTVRLDEAQVNSAGGIGREAVQGADVAFEFTTATSAEENVRGLIDAGCAVVCGTTGWVPSEGLIERAKSSESAVVLAANFSVGMNLFYRMVSEAGRLLGAAGQHEPYLVEVHHRGKRDAPSGTARKLAELLIASDSRLDGIAEGERHGPAQSGMLPVHSVRAGSDPGRHTVVWDGPFDRIVLEHAARSRDGFALGAVLAAENILELQGLHTFDDILDRMLDDRSND
jgi:4-hydroxy-tetrahydrodipicolinate reductase